MAGVEDEDEFRDADDADATAPPPSSTSVSTPSKPKPAAAAAGFGRRLLASIPLPATFSAAIGRPSTPSSPKPPPPPASEVGLGLLLNPGREPSADSSDASAHNLHLPPTTALQQQHGEEVLEEQGTSVQRAHLALQHREDQVVGHDVGGVGEELVVLVPMEEECRLTAEGREKEGVADGCSANKNGFSLQDHEEGEQRTSVELGATMEDQDVVEQEGATKYYTAVEDQSNNAAEQCAGDAPRAIKNDNIVEDQEVVNQEGATKYYTAVEDQSNNAAEQCAGDAPRAIKDDNDVEDEEVVEQERATKYYSDVEDQSNNAAEQWAGDAPRAIKDDNVVEEKERAMEQGGPVGILCAAEDGIAVGSQEEEGVVVEGQGEDGISVLYQHKMVEQCMSDELRVAMGDSAVQGQEVVVVEQEEVTDYYDAVVEDQSNNAAVEQCTSDELRAVKDGNIVEEKEKAVEQEGAIGILGAAEDGIAVGSQEQEEKGEEEVVVVAEQGEDAISLQDHDKVVEQCSSDQLRTTADDNAAQDHEVVEQEGAIVERGATVDGIAVEAQEKAVEQSAGDESRATKDENAVEDKEKVVNQGVIDKQGAIKDGSAVEPQNEEDVVVAEQGEDDISVQDQDKVVEQCTSDQLRTTTDDNDAEDQEVSREKVRLSAGYPQRPGRPNCRFYMSNGSCSYGLSCYYNHPQLKAKPEVSSFLSEQGNREVAEFLELNHVGLPIREGARNCTYFMRNGTCRYGKKCCFNHPEQVLDAQLYMPTGWDDTNLPSSPHLKKSSEHAILDDLSSSSEFLPPNILRMLLPPQNVPPTTEEREMKVKKDPDWSSASDDSDGCCLADGSGGPLCKQEHADYSERPGRQECPFLLRFGNCKFTSACQYYHPKDKFSSRYHPKDPSLAEEPMVYPEKPGEPECPFYMKTRFCKFGAECKFHHPKDLPPSMRAPTIPKRSIAANEDHPTAKTTLQDHMYLQQKYPERPGEPACRYYMQFGKCKFLSACVFHHPKERLQSGWRPIAPVHSNKYETWQPTHTFRSEDHCQQEQNILGMPECPFYMKTGTCQFGSACDFDHPKHWCSSRGSN